LAIGLNNTVYLWNATAGEHSKLLELGNDDIVTSLQWTADGRFVAVGTRAAELQLWDAERCVQLRSLAGHQSRGKREITDLI
jgi:WD40 repeat protein